MWGHETSPIPPIHQSQPPNPSRGMPINGIIHRVTPEVPALPVGSNCRRQRPKSYSARCVRKWFVMVLLPEDAWFSYRLVTPSTLLTKGDVMVIQVSLFSASFNSDIRNRSKPHPNPWPLYACVYSARCGEVGEAAVLF